MYPLHCAAPMGFAASAAWAQAATEACTTEAGLPEGARVVEGRPTPLEGPIWGSILDDVWTLEEETASGTAPVGRAWVGAVTDAWERHGVHGNRKKDVFEQVTGELHGGLRGR